MRDVKTVIGEIINAFVQQELGNKITQFNMQGLVQILFSELDKLEEEGNNKQEE